MYRTFLSWRYLIARRTNLIGIVGIFVGVAALIMILSIMTGFLDESRKAIRGSLADVLVTPFAEPGADGNGVPREPGPILEVIEADPRVVAAAPHLRWFGMMLLEGEDSDRDFVLRVTTQLGDLPLVELVGIDLEREFAATDLRAALEREPATPLGKPVADPERPFAPPPGYEPTGRPKAWVVVGEQLFNRRALRRGDEINLGTLVPDPETGELVESNRKFLVAGSFRSGENETDLARVYMDRAELRDFVGDVRGFSEILVKLEDYPRDHEAVCADLRRTLFRKGLISGRSGEVLTWEEFRINLLGAIENERVLMAIMLSLVLIVAGFTVFAILSMMVTEKRRDIGILAAVGATPRGILRLFLRIGFWDALVGASLGAVIGSWAAIQIDPIERWLSRTFGVEIFNREVYYFDHIPSRVEPLAVAVIFVGAMLCTLLFSAIPAWRASRMDPIEALRHE